jgi:hypothetical protein
MRFRFAPHCCLAIIASLASISAAYAGGTEYTDLTAYQSAATTAGVVTFNRQAPIADFVVRPFYSEGNASVHAYYRLNGVFYDLAFIYDAILNSDSFDGTDYYIGYAGTGPYYGVPDGHGYIETTFAQGRKYTAAGLDLGSLYAHYGPVNDYSATLSFYDGANLVFTTGGHSFPSFYIDSPHYGFLGAVTDAPFDRVLLETTPGDQSAWWLADNIRYGDAITPVAVVPEPNIANFALLVSGIVGGLIIRQRRRVR